MTRRSVLAATAGSLSGLLWAAGPAKTKMRVGVASYSLRKFSRADAIPILQKLHVDCLSIKELHLLYRDSPEALVAGRKEFDQAGIPVSSGGVIVTYKEDASGLRRYFEYGKTCRFPMMIWMPTEAQLPVIDKLSAEFGIRVALHNHGPEDKNFPTPQAVYEAIRKFDRRIGLCIDVGHSARAGVDVPAAIEKYHDRLVDVHMKDLRDLNGHTDCVVGTGKLPIVDILTSLHKVKYQGCINLEYEAEPEHPVEGMQKSLAFLRSTIARIEGGNGRSG